MSSMTNRDQQIQLDLFLVFIVLLSIADGIAEQLSRVIWQTRSPAVARIADRTGCQ